jgi:hypothetical protein
MNSSFPKLFAIGTEYIHSLFDEPVEITEKLDGSQFGFGKTEDGDVFCRSKGKIQHIDAPDKMFQQGADYVKSIADKLPEGVTFYGEYLQKPKHSTLAYDRIPTNHIALFGIKYADGHYEHDYSVLADRAAELGIDVVPLIYAGKVDTPGELKANLERESYLGGQKIEGFVVKRYTPWMFGSIVMPLMGGKYVSEAFKEVHRESWKSDNTDGGKWGRVIESFHTSARWHKAAMHLDERGELEHSPRDIGKLMKEVRLDIEAESKEEIKEQMWSIFKEQLLKRATAGLPEWYKQQLLERSFDAVPEK